MLGWFFGKPSRKTPIHIGCDNLHATFHYLSRWDLDTMPMVCRLFRSAAALTTTTVAAISGPNGVFPQLRVIDNFFSDRRPDHRSILMYRKGFAAACQRVLLAHTGRGGHMYGSSWIALDDDQMLIRLLDVEPSLRARNAVLFDCDRGAPVVELASFERAEHFTRIWRGCPLTLVLHSTSSSLPPTLSALLGSASSLSVRASQLVWGVEERDALTLSRCQRLELHAPCQGITWEHVIDFLFFTVQPEAEEGSRRKSLKRELRIRKLLPQADLPDNYLPSRLRQLLEKRLEAHMPCVPSFTVDICIESRSVGLRLISNVVDEEVDLIGLDFSPQAGNSVNASSSSSSVELPPPSAIYRCLFTVKRKGTLIRVKVDCE